MQCRQLFLEIKRLQAPLLANPKRLTLQKEPMETKHVTKHEVRRGTIQLWSSSIRVTDESGDVVEIDFPYSAFRDALKDLVVSSLSQSTQEELIELMTNDIRQREERQAKRDAEIAAETMS